MVRARLDESWDRTAAVIAAVYTNKAFNKHLYRPHDFHPLARRRPVKMSRKESLDYLGRFSQN